MFDPALPSAGVVTRGHQGRNPGSDRTATAGCVASPPRAAPVAARASPACPPRPGRSGRSPGCGDAGCSPWPARTPAVVEVGRAGERAAGQERGLQLVMEPLDQAFDLRIGRPTHDHLRRQRAAKRLAVHHRRHRPPHIPRRTLTGQRRPHRVPRDPQHPRDLRDRHALRPAQPPDSAQSSTPNTCFLPDPTPARVSGKLVNFQLPRPAQYSLAVDTTNQVVPRSCRSRCWPPPAARCGSPGRDDIRVSGRRTSGRSTPPAGAGPLCRRACPTMPAGQAARLPVLLRDEHPPHRAESVALTTHRVGAAFNPPQGHAVHGFLCDPGVIAPWLA